ncbi:armadillo repeat-containing protein 3 isoform X3 [Nothobranchius furzeri]|uniref:Transcript variant X3 n=1 Tax=Nothobranchius furzeri TaxID=105023 RepID=A0A9D2Y5N2_NOTFU|nr:transcript variant X3 [Nothobranchius furzeri]
MGKTSRKESETPCKETFEPFSVEVKTQATAVSLLNSPEEDIIVKACEAIRTFAEKGDENKVSLLGLGALEPLCRLINHNNRVIRGNAFTALGIMATNGDVSSVLKKLNIIPSVIEKLTLDEDTVIHEYATLCLTTLSVDFVGKAQIFENNGLPPLIVLLSSSDPDVKKNSLQVIFNLVQLIHSNGGLARLLEFILTPNTPEIKCITIKCLTRVAQSSESRKVLHEQDVEKVLVGLLSVENTSVKALVCQAVAAMGLHPSSRDSFRDLGCIPAMVELLSSENLALREAASQALSSLTVNNQPNAFAVYTAGGHKILVRLLNGSCSKTVASSAATLCLMAGEVVIRSSILSHKGMEALVEPLKSKDPQVLVNSMQCVTVLACDKEARTQFRQAGGLQLLVNLLQTKDKDVLHNACLAVNVLASDKPSSVEMCRIGALEMLEEIKHSENHRNRFSELAMISLLNCNLSVKYSLMGHLSPTDMITGGFYDAGKACSGQMIPTLEELFKQPVNYHRPIIFADSAAEKKKEKVKHTDEPHFESTVVKPQGMIDDVSLQMLVKKAKESIFPLKDDKEQYSALARVVSDAMGGAVGMEKLHEFPWELHLSELKVLLKSNVIPIGSINKGFYCHRALLFKYLADCIEMSCSLVRGEYNRAWNEVVLFRENPTNRSPSQPCHYIVDLMHQPGALLGVDTLAALQYQTI